MNTQRQFLLGMLFVVALSVLGYYTLFLTDFRLFKELHTIVVTFPSASGLRKGDAVLVAGIRAGKVRSLSYDPDAPDDRRVTVELSLDESLLLREGHSIEIGAATLLGGHNVVIDPGPAGGPAVPEDTVLAGTLAVDALAGLSEIVSDNRERIDAILENVAAASADLQATLADLRAGEGLLARLLSDPALADSGAQALENATKTFTNLGELTDGVVAGRGVIGKLFTDEDLVVTADRIAANLDAIVAELRTITEDVEDGRGAAGVLLRNDAAAEDVARSLESTRAILERIRAGEGTLGRLVADDALAENVHTIARRLAEGEGTLGRLLVDDALYLRLDSASADLAQILADVRAGRGTVGRLLTDDAIYAQIERALAIVNRGLEEYRETAPITSFTGVLFGAF